MYIERAHKMNDIHVYIYIHICVKGYRNGFKKKFFFLTTSFKRKIRNVRTSSKTKNAFKTLFYGRPVHLVCYMQPHIDTYGCSNMTLKTIIYWTLLTSNHMLVTFLSSDSYNIDAAVRACIISAGARTSNTRYRPHFIY